MTSALGPSGPRGREGTGSTAAGAMPAPRTAAGPGNAGGELPLYVQIRTKLRNEIASGVYAQGDYLPPADQLSKKYGASKNTILRALRMLRSEGVIDFGRGRGAVVLRSVQRVGFADISVQLQQVVNLADRSGIPRVAIISAIERMPRPLSARVRTYRGPGRPGPRGAL